MVPVLLLEAVADASTSLLLATGQMARCLAGLHELAVAGSSLCVVKDRLVPMRWACRCSSTMVRDPTLWTTLQQRQSLATLPCVRSNEVKPELQATEVRKSR